MHKYAIQVTVADVRDGALPARTLKEASSWGKVDTAYEQMVFSEATLRPPLIAGYAQALEESRGATLESAAGTGRGGGVAEWGMCRAIGQFTPAARPSAWLHISLAQERCCARLAGILETWRQLSRRSPC